MLSRVACLVCLIAVSPLGLLAAEPPSWVEPMREVHAGFQGTPGYVAQFGDSITYSNAFWTPLDWDAPQKYLAADDPLPAKPSDKRWRDWIQGERAKGPQHGNYSGWTVKNLLKAVPEVLKREQPEVAIIMIGTNDISGNKVPESYAEDLEQIVQQCLDAHCIVLLNTIPPRVNRTETVKQVNEIIRAIAAKHKVPLVDYHAEIMQRRPKESWQGTLISADGVHPTGGKTNIYSSENLSNCGYALRNWVNFLALREVYFHVLHVEQQ